MNFLLGLIMACGCVAVGKWLYSMGVIAYSKADAIMKTYRFTNQLKKQIKNKDTGKVDK